MAWFISSFILPHSSFCFRPTPIKGIETSGITGLDCWYLSESPHPCWGDLQKGWRKAASTAWFVSSFILPHSSFCFRLTPIKGICRKDEGWNWNDEEKPHQWHDLFHHSSFLIHHFVFAPPLLRGLKLYPYKCQNSSNRQVRIAPPLLRGLKRGEN